MCMDSAVTRINGSANLGRVCTQNDWVAVGWLFCPTWPLISQQGSHAKGGHVRASIDTQEDSSDLDLTPHNPFSQGLLNQIMHRASPDSRDGKTVFTSLMRRKTTVHGKGNKCRYRKYQGPKVTQSTLCAFFHTERSLWKLAVYLFPLSKTLGTTYQALAPDIRTLSSVIRWPMSHQLFISLFSASFHDCFAPLFMHENPPVGPARLLFPLYSVSLTEQGTVSRSFPKQVGEAETLVR